MNRRFVAKKLIRMAKELSAEDTMPPEMSTVDDKFVAMDPQLNMLAQKIANTVGADLKKLATLMVMAMRKSGDRTGAQRLYSVLKPFLPVMERRVTRKTTVIE